MLNDASGFKRIYIACGQTDLRRGIEGLATMIRFQFKLDPYDKDTLFLFCGKKNNRIKGLLWEGDGFLLLYKRLEAGAYSWPRNTSESYMWVYRSGYMNPEKQIILYEYQLTRNASHPREFLKEFKGICVTDGYQVYHTLEKEKEDLTIAGCWVHMRRRFEQAWEVIPKEARKGTISYMAMKQIQAIYREEGKLKELHSKERLEQRQAIIKPLVDAFFVYLKQNQTEVPGSGKLHDAFTYALNQEKYLKVFLEDGEVPIDNNASERAIRGFCVGKKNWHMIDTINGAKTSAMIYSIAETAKANNLKPYDYFEHLLEEIPKHMEDTDRSFLKELLPWSDKLPKHIRK